MGQIFISYSYKDKAYVYKLHQVLLKHGFDAWADDRQNDSLSWPNEIEARLKECDAFILVMSPAAKASHWVQSELRLAIENHKTIVPLRLEGDVWLDVFRLNIFDIRGGTLPDTKFYAHLAEISQPGMPRHSASLAPSLDAAALRPITPPTAPKETDQTIVENHPAKSSAKTVTKRISDDVSSRHEHRYLIINLLGLAVMIFATMIVLKPFFTPPSPSAQTPTPTNKQTSIPSVTPVPLEMMQGGAKMVLVPAGPFIMGSNTGRENEKPVRTVDLPAFYIDVYEVTNLLYKACVTAQTCQPPTVLDSYRQANYYSDTAYDQYPVNYVDWDRAKTYCEWRGARLPSEAEWEKAARGSDGRTFPWGKNWPDDTYTNQTRGTTTPVGSYQKGKSPYNIYDMAGNVWEWVDDWYDRYPDSSAVDVNFGQTHRVMRGGGFSTSSDIRSPIRVGSIPSYTGVDVGFRCALPLPK